jgi:hypothetical protein
MMKKNVLRHTLIEALKEVFGPEVVLPSFYSGKLKDGTQVYRISGTGWGYGTLYKQDGKIWMRPERNAEPVHVTKEELMSIAAEYAELRFDGDTLLCPMHGPSLERCQRGFAWDQQT